MQLQYLIGTKFIQANLVFLSTAKWDIKLLHYQIVMMSQTNH